MPDFLQDNFNYYIDCPIVTIEMFMHNAKSGCCEICAALDGDWWATEDGQRPYEMDMHDNCRCTWDRERARGLMPDTIEELQTQHADIMREIAQAEADVEFRKYDMEEWKLKEAQYLEDKASALASAAAALAEENRLLAEAEAIIASNDELTQEQQDEVDSLVHQAEMKQEEAELAEEQAEIAQDNATEAHTEWRYHEDEMDAAEKRVILWNVELLHVEPCLEWPNIYDEIEKIGGSRINYAFG